MTPSRREAALELAEELLGDIELSRVSPPDLARKASRLARLLDDADALSWLSFETGGYPQGGLSAAAVAAARRSGRQAEDSDSGESQYWTGSLDALQGRVDAGLVHLQSAVDRPVSVSSANPHQTVFAPPGNAQERTNLSDSIVKQRAIIGAVVGALHSYVAEKEVELRFGSAVEGAFSNVRSVVDSRIADLVPEAAVMLAAAFENASSGNSEHWANAASTCRRLLKAVADALRPAGSPANGRAMTDDKYINRLVDWIVGQGGVGGTFKDVVTSDLENFGKRLDALDDAGHKGAHSTVTQYDASRFIAGVYLLLGDILAIRAVTVENEPAVGLIAHREVDPVDVG